MYGYKDIEDSRKHEEFKPSNAGCTKTYPLFFLSVFRLQINYFEKYNP